MKTVTYTCDKCSTVFSTDEGMITIGSESERELKYKNNIKTGRALLSMDRHMDIHFCSKSCFINYFFHE